MVSALGLSKAEWRTATANGVDISIPSEKIVTVTAKPWWNKIRDYDGRGIEEPIISVIKSGPAYGRPHIAELPSKVEAPPVAPVPVTPAPITPPKPPVKAPITPPEVPKAEAPRKCKI